MCVALFCIKYMSQRDGNRKRPKKDEKMENKLKIDCDDRRHILLLLQRFSFVSFSLAFVTFRRQKGKEEKKKTSFWLVGFFFFSGILSLSLSCVNAKENNNKTRRRAASKKNQTQHTHTQRCRLSSAHGCSCALSLSPLYEIEEEEAKGH